MTENTLTMFQIAIPKSEAPTVAMYQHPSILLNQFTFSKWSSLQAACSIASTNVVMGIDQPSIANNQVNTD